MSLTSEELNYLIWRYLQETGLEIPAFALQDATLVHELEDRYGSRVPKGCLVNLVQRGILYTEDSELVDSKGRLRPPEELQKSLTLFGALRTIQEQEAPQLATPGPEPLSAPLSASQRAPQGTQIAHFTRVLSPLRTLSSAAAGAFAPSLHILALGTHASSTQLLGETTVSLPHPRPVLGEAAEVTCVAWAPSGGLLALATSAGDVRLWLASGKLRSVCALHADAVIALCWRSDSAQLLSVDSKGNAIVWDAATGLAAQTVALQGGGGTCAAWLGRSHFAVAAQNVIVLHQLGETAAIGTLAGHTFAIGCLAYCEQLKLLALGADDAQVRIWRGSATLSAQVLEGHDQSIVSLHWLSRARPTLVLSALDGLVRVWDVYSGACVGTCFFDGVPVYETGLSKDGRRLAVATEDGSVHVLDLEGIGGVEGAETIQITVEALYEPQEGNKDDLNYVTSVTWSSDGQELFVGYNKGDSVVLGGWSGEGVEEGDAKDKIEIDGKEEEEGDLNKKSLKE